MASAYPSGLDNQSTSHQDNVGEFIHASTVNDLADAVNKIEAELGTLPKGNFASVSAKLKALFYGSVTTTQRDAITTGNRPAGLIVFNTTTNRYEYNSGNDTTPTWSPVGPAGPWGTADIQDSAITSAKIADSTIVNADISSSAAISLSKLNTSGTANSSTWMRGDSQWTSLSLGTVGPTLLSADQALSQNVWTDITGISVSLAAGVWVINTWITFARSGGNSASYTFAITDAANTVANSIGGPGQGLANGEWGGSSITTLVSPGTTTTYKARVQVNNINQVIKAAAPISAGNNATGIFAFKIG